jgi:hypothetical protein
MGAVIMKLHNSWKWVVLIKLQLSCNELHCIYDVTYPLALMAYTYNELQMSYAIQKLNYKASCKTPFFHNVCPSNLLTYLPMPMYWLI